MNHESNPPDHVDYEIPNETENMDSFTELNLIGNIRESNQLKSISSTPTAFGNLSVISSYASNNNPQNQAEQSILDTRSRTPRNIRVLQSKDKINQLREECKRVNQIVQNSVNHVSKIIERNANKISKSITNVENKNSHANPNRLIQQIPELANDDEAFPNTTLIIESTRAFELSAKKVKNVYDTQAAKVTAKKMENKKTGTNERTKHASDCEGKAGSIKTPLRPKEGTLNINISTPHFNIESHLNQVYNMSSKAKGPNLIKSQNTSALLPRYARDTLLSLYKGYKIRKILKSHTIASLASEITELKKIIMKNIDAKEETKLKDRIAKHMKDFDSRFYQIISDRFWYKCKSVGLLKNKVSTELLNGDLNKISIDKDQNTKSKAEKKVEWHTLEEKKRLRDNKKSSTTSVDTSKDITSERKTDVKKEHKIDAMKNEENKKKENRKDDKKKVENKKGDNHIEVVLNKRDDKPITKAKEETKRRKEVLTEIKQSPQVKPFIVKQDSLKKLPTTECIENDLMPQYTFDNSMMQESDPKVEDLVQKLYNFFVDIKKNNGYQATLATKKRVLDKTLENIQRDIKDVFDIYKKDIK